MRNTQMHTGRARGKRVAATATARATLNAEPNVWFAIRRVARRDGKLMWAVIRDMASRDPEVGPILREIEGAQAKTAPPTAP